MVDTFLIIFFIPFSLASAIVGIWTLIKGIRYRKKIKFIDRVKHRKIKNVKGGLVKLKGWIEKIDGNYTETPINKIPCIYYHTVVYKLKEVSYATSGNIHFGEGIKKNSIRIPIWKRKQGFDFLVSDGTGKMRLNALSCDLDITTKEVEMIYNIYTASRGFQDFLKKEKIERDLLDYLIDGYKPREFLVEEEYLSPGQHILVVGKVRKLEKGPNNSGIIPYTLTKVNDEKWSMISDRKEPIMKDVLFWKFLGFLSLSILLWSFSIFIFIFSIYLTYY